jgi:putative acyl-CoA dehydrogenase
VAATASPHNQPVRQTGSAPELAQARGADRVFDRELDLLQQTLAAPTAAVEAEADVRRLVEQLAVCWGASLCLRYEPAIADVYVRSRLDGDWGTEFGTLGGQSDLARLARRACPLPIETDTDRSDTGGM